MRTTCFIFLCCLTRLLASVAIAQDTIPFTLTAYNNILLPAVLNGRDTVQLMFHSSNAGVALTKDGVKRCASITTDGQGTAHSWGGDASSPFSTGNTLRIGAHSWDSLMVTVDEHSGQGSDGKFGPDLFGARTLEIDHDDRVFIVHEALPAIAAEAMPWPLQLDDGRLYTEATVTLDGNSHTDRFMLHTGYGGTCILGTTFMAHLPPGTALDTLGVKELKDALGNTLKNIAARARAISFGGQVLTDTRIQVMDPRSHFDDNVLGNDLFRRFNAVIDLRTQRLYLRPNGVMNAPFSERY